MKKDIDLNRNKNSKNAVIIGMILNILIFIIKFAIGIFISSVAILADSFNNLTDALSNIIVMLGIKLSVKPADREHPFGHGRVEYLVALILACIMIVIGIEFFRVSVTAVFFPSPVFMDFWLMLLLLLTSCIKLFMWIYYSYVGKSTDSSPIKALAMDSRNDVFITCVTVGSVFFTSLTNIIIDGYIGIIISCVIIYSGYQVAKETISKILGESPDKETSGKILNLVEKNENIIGSHDLMIHTYGPSITMATLHVDMPNSLTLDQAHSIIDSIERLVKKELGINLLLHIDPTPLEDKRLIKIKEKTMSFLHGINEKLDAHDFKISEMGKKFNIIFEVVFPYEFDKEKEDIIIKSLTSIIQSIDENYNVIIEPEYR